MAVPIISFDQVSFQYDSQAEANLKEISFEIKQGEIVLILGPSGSGKSTLAKCINGQIPHTFPGKLSGNIQINGVDPRSTSLFALSLEVGTVLQDTDGQFVGLTVAEDLAFALENDGVDQAKMREIVHEWSSILKIEDLLDQKPHNLSGGQKQRVSIGGVLVNEVPILLFDEPLANLDPASGERTIELINSLNKELGVTVIIIEHRLEESLIADIDQVILLNEGEIVSISNVDQLLKSDLLSQVGLRQPLYLQALKYAGVQIDQLGPLNHYRKTKIPSYALEKVQSWYQDIPEHNAKLSRPKILEITDLAFKYPYQNTPGLKDINLSIQAGDRVSIVGSNGAGKSTLAKLICGFERPQKGQIRIDGQDTASMSIKEIADQVGYVMQNPNTMISQTLIFDEVALGLKNRGYHQADIEERVYESLKICGLYSMRNWPISALSYGQKRRVTIASILVLQPKILILDEPTAGQDYYHYSQFMTFIETLNQDHGLTIIMITHDMHLMQEYTERTLVLNQGRLLANSTPAKVLSQKDLMTQADLVPTSLYYLGQDLDQISTENFIQKFMDYERRVTKHEPS